MSSVASTALMAFLGALGWNTQRTATETLVQVASAIQEVAGAIGAGGRLVVNSSAVAYADVLTASAGTVADLLCVAKYALTLLVGLQLWSWFWGRDRCCSCRRCHRRWRPEALTAVAVRNEDDRRYRETPDRGVIDRLPAPQAARRRVPMTQPAALAEERAQGSIVSPETQRQRRVDTCTPSNEVGTLPALRAVTEASLLRHVAELEDAKELGRAQWRDPLRVSRKDMQDRITLGAWVCLESPSTFSTGRHPGVTFRGQLSETFLLWRIPGVHSVAEECCVIWRANLMLVDAAEGEDESFRVRQWVSCSCGEHKLLSDQVCWHAGATLVRGVRHFRSLAAEIEPWFVTEHRHGQPPAVRQNKNLESMRVVVARVQRKRASATGATVGESRKELYRTTSFVEDDEDSLSPVGSLAKSLFPEGECLRPVPPRGLLQIQDGPTTTRTSPTRRSASSRRVLPSISEMRTGKLGNFDRTAASWRFRNEMSRKESIACLAALTGDRLQLDPTSLVGHVDLSGARFYPESGHPLMAICDAAATHAIAVAMCKDRSARWILLMGFTFDSEEIAAALSDAADAGIPTTVLLDKDEALYGSAKGRASCLRRLLHSGVDAFLGSGDTRPGVGGRGRIHGKTLVTGSGLALIGSSNWTRASQSNLEMTSFLRIPKAAQEDFRATAQWAKDVMVPLDIAHVEEATTRQEERSSKSKRHPASSLRSSSLSSSSPTIRYPSPES